MRFAFALFYLFLMMLVGYMAAEGTLDTFFAKSPVPPTCVSAADPVKEYAMNRLCKISTGECLRLAHVTIQDVIDKNNAALKATH